MFGPYLGRRAKWSILTLQHVAKIIYKTCDATWPSCKANIVMLYEVMPHSVLYYTDEYVSKLKHYLQVTFHLQLNYPSIIHQEYTQYQWHIRTHVYEKLIVTVYISQSESGGILYNTKESFYFKCTLWYEISPNFKI